MKLTARARDELITASPMHKIALALTFVVAFAATSDGQKLVDNGVDDRI